MLPRRITMPRHGIMMMIMKMKAVLSVFDDVAVTDTFFDDNFRAELVIGAGVSAVI